MCPQHLDLRITTDSQNAASLDDYATIRQHGSLDDTTTVCKSNYDAGIEYLDRNYGNASNGDSLKNISGIMGESSLKTFGYIFVLTVVFVCFSLSEYDGSPRRFGQNNDLHLPCSAQNQKTITSSLFSSPRPGFPQVRFSLVVKDFPSYNFSRFCLLNVFNLLETDKD